MEGGREGWERRGTVRGKRSEFLLPSTLILPPSSSFPALPVNPGGWAPPSVVRTIGKREITKFLRKFSSTAQKRTIASPLTL